MRIALLVALAVVLAGCGLIDQLNGPDKLAIQQFTASPEQVTSGAAAMLSWDVQGADSVQIDNGIGTVAAKGSKQIAPGWTTTYTLSAKGGTSSATATVQVVVRGSGLGAPSSFPSPGPSPNPSPEPTPEPSPSPGPSPSPSPSPEPSPTPAPGECGTPVSSAGACDLNVAKPTKLAEGQCIELVELTAAPDCPVALDSSRNVTFAVKSVLPGAQIRWRKGDGSADEVTPASGDLDATGKTVVHIADSVKDDGVNIQVYDVETDAILLRFSLKRR